MSRIYVFTAIAVVLTAGLLVAENDGDYQSWMKTVGATNGSMQKNLASKNAAAVAADACHTTVGTGPYTAVRVSYTKPP